MEFEGAEFAVIAETTSFLGYFKDMPDNRQAGKVEYPLAEILLLSLLAVLAGAEAFTDIARFGEKKLDLLHPIPLERSCALSSGNLSPTAFGRSIRVSASTPAHSAR